MDLEITQKQARFLILKVRCRTIFKAVMFFTHVCSYDKLIVPGKVIDKGQSVATNPLN